MLLPFSAQSCPTVCNPMVCPWNSLGKNTEVGCHSLFPGNLPNSGIEPWSPALQADSLPSAYSNYILDIRLKGKTIKYI